MVPWRLLRIWGRTCKTNHSWLHEIKLVGCRIICPIHFNYRAAKTSTQIGFTILGALQIALLALFSTTQVGHRAVLISSATLQLCTNLLLAALSHWEHRNSIRPSFLISAFLFITAILDAARARTHALIEGQNSVASILTTTVVVKLLLLLIESKEKTRILLPEYSNISSELRSGLFSRAFFIWLIPVLTAGFKGVISHDDLPVVSEKLSSESLTARVESRWKDGT